METTSIIMGELPTLLPPPPTILKDIIVWIQQNLSHRGKGIARGRGNSTGQGPRHSWWLLEQLQTDLPQATHEQLLIAMKKCGYKNQEKWDCIYFDCDYWRIEAKHRNHKGRESWKNYELW